MKLELLKENDPQLMEVSEPWDFESDGDPTELVKDMVRVLTENGGVGLAAPQCGVRKRIFIMGNFTKMVVCINPKIVSVTEEYETDLEGCLSFPDLWMKVKRPAGCVVSYQTISGEVKEEEIKGFMARVYLHEYDHLIGVTFDQRVGYLKIKMAKEKREKDLKKKARAA
jgi:peptide deformylase